MTMRSSASRLVLLIRRWGLMFWTAIQPALTMPWRVGAGGSHTASTPHALVTRRRCYKTAWSLLQGDRLSRARNCTTRRAGPGLPQAASTPHAILTRRRCYKMAWSLLQGDKTAISIFLPRPPNCTTRRAGPGRPQAASTPHAPVTRRRCYKTASSSLLPGERTAISTLPRVQNSDTVTAKIHWEGSKKRPSRSLNHPLPKQKITAAGKQKEIEARKPETAG